MFDFWETLIPFLIMHVICDFYLQPNKWVKAKELHTYRSPELYYHSLLHGFSLLIPIIILGVDWKLGVCLIAIVTITHFMIDLWKVTTPNRDKFSYFIIDQTLHILVLVIITFYMVNDLSLESILKHDKFSASIMIIFAYLLILKPTSIVIGTILKKYPISGPDEKDDTTKGIVAGGELIGYLERVLILTFTLVGSYAAVGFVLAAKSIFRFGELNKSNNRSMTEYVLIGSMLSVVITTLLGAIISIGLDIKIK